MTFSLNSESTANWEAADGEKWTVPINAMVSKITKFGPWPFQIGIGAGHYAEKPAGGPEWQLRTQFTILPRGK